MSDKNVSNDDKEPLSLATMGEVNIQRIVDVDADTPEYFLVETVRPADLSQVTCACSKKVAMAGTPGKDYRVISTTSPKGHQKWVLHNDPSCYAEVMVNLQNAQS